MCSSRHMWIVVCLMHAADAGGISCKDHHQVGVASPWRFRYGRDISSTGNRAYVMLGDTYKISCCGYVKGWEFQASTRAQIRPIEFQIWRHANNLSTGLFTLIGQHSVWYMKGKTRTVNVMLEKDEYIFVDKGNLIGWHTPLGDVIDYATTDGRLASLHYMTPYMTALSVGQNFSFGEEVKGGRMYGVKAILAAVPNPQIVNLPKRVTFKCPVPNGHRITTVQARPFHKNEQIQYSIDGYSPWFGINKTSGEIKTIMALHGNMTHDITVVAASTCDAHTSSMLTLHCIDIGTVAGERRDTEQTIRQHDTESPTSVNKSGYHVTFRESVTSETVLRVINSTSENDLICTVSGTRPPILIDVLYTSGDILLIKSRYQLLFNTTSVVYVDLTCIQTDGQIYEELVVIHVIKDLEPVFDNLPAMLRVSAKNTAVGDVVFQAHATDREGQVCVFTMVNCTCPFTMNKDGAVTVTTDLRKIFQESFELKVFVGDGFSQIGPVDLNIVVTGLNHQPHFISLPHEVIVPENSEGTVLSIQYHDPDKDNDVTVLWAWENIAAVKYFTFDESDNRLYVNHAVHLDYEYQLKTVNQTSFCLLLTLTDGFLSSETERVLIHVTDVNEGPRFLAREMNVTCKEGQAGSQVLDSEIKMMVTDPDISDVLTFQLLPGSYSDKFAINSMTGQVIFTSDYDTDPSRLPSNVQLLIQVSDLGNLTAVLKVFLTIENINVPPAVQAPHSVTVSEDIPGGSTLFMISVIDWDTGDNLSVTTVCTDHSDKLFNYTEAGTVALKENSSLDFETIRMFTFRIQANDGQITSEPVFVLLHILDVNEPPIRMRDIIHIEMQEGKAGDIIPGLELTDVFSDPDQDALIFGITQKNDSAWSTFLIDSSNGWLYLSHDVDITRLTSPLILLFDVAAYDPEQLFASVVIEVTFTFVNTRPTLLVLPAWISILESTPLNNMIFTVLTDDRDGDNITLRYEVYQGNEMMNFISVNLTSGEISYVGPTSLSQGQTAEMSIVFTAFDSEMSSLPEMLNISVFGVNDPPRFLRDEYRFVINESEVGVNLISPDLWTDIDPDPGDTLTFIKIGGVGEEHVYVDANTGVMKVKDNYDIDSAGNMNNLTVGVMARDPYSLTATTSILISIIDINDNVPVVENDGETFSVNLNLTADRSIGHIRATDMDSGRNGAITFSIIGSTLNETFHYFIISNSGWIFSTGQIPPVDHTTLYIAVSDGGQPSNVVMATAHVIFFKSTNETLASSLLQSLSFRETDVDKTDNENKSAVILVMISLIACCLVIIMVLSYQLWKAKKVSRSTQPEQDHDAHHEYQFRWVPRQIVEESGDDNPRPPQSASEAIQSFLGTSILNENFQYEPGALCSSVVRPSSSCDQENSAQLDLANPGRRHEFLAPTERNAEDEVFQSDVAQEKMPRTLVTSTTQNSGKTTWDWAEQTERWSNNTISSHPSSTNDENISYNLQVNDNLVNSYSVSYKTDPSKKAQCIEVCSSGSRISQNHRKGIQHTQADRENMITFLELSPASGSNIKGTFHHSQHETSNVQVPGYECPPVDQSDELPRVSLTGPLPGEAEESTTQF